MHEFKRRFPPAPSDWSRPRLADIAERVTTRNVERNPNVLTISAEFGLISQSEFFSRRVASESVVGYFLLERGDFAYNKSYSRGYPLGAIRRLDRYEKGCVSPLYICFRPRAGTVDSDFLLHYLDGGAIDAGLADVAKEGVRNHGLLNVGVADFFGLEVPLPPVAEQRAAAQVLDTLDTTIRQTEAIIEKLKQVKQGLLHDLLTRGIDANGELRPPQSHAPHLYKESPLGWIPMEWDAITVGAAVQRSGGAIQTGPFGSQLHAYEYVPEGVPVIMPQDILDGTIDRAQIAMVSDRKAATMARHQVAPNDVVFSRRGDLSRSATIGERERGWLCGTGCLLVRLPKTEILGAWLSLVYRQPVVQAQVLGRAVGTTMANLNTSILSDLLVTRPPVSEQNEIGQRISALSLRLEAESDLIDKLRLEKSGLMDDLLTGRVRVTPLLQPEACA